MTGMTSKAKFDGDDKILEFDRGATKKTKRIFIGIPCYDSVAAQTLEDYMRLAFYLGRRYPEYEFYMQVKDKSEQFRARNALVQSALNVGADWMLMLDDDHIIDVEGVSGKPGKGAECYDFLHRLLAHDVDIVGPIYYHRGGEAGPVVMEERDGGFRNMQTNQLTGGLQEVAVQGGGCMLIKMKIFDKLEQPWFKPEHVYGTDVQLCRNAKKAGFRVYTDSSVQIGHVMSKRIIISEKNREQFKEDTIIRAANTLASDWHANSVLNEYKMDAMTYLKIDEESKLRELYDQYAEDSMNLSERHGLGTPKYYAHMGDSQIGRQVLYHFSPHALSWLSFCLMNIHVTRPLTGIDFGCGSAPIGFELLRRGHTVYFHDMDGAAAFKFLKWRIKRYGVVDRAIYNEWPTEGLAYALFCDVLEHLEDWHDPIKRTVDAMIPQGILFTNYMVIDKDVLNVEHSNWDRPEFMRYMTELGMEPLGNCVFMKTGGSATGK